MGTHPIFESDFDCLTECHGVIIKADPLLVVPVGLVSIQWVKISPSIQVQLAWQIHKVDQLDQWGVNKPIQWVRVIRLALVVVDQLDRKWVILQIIIKWRQIRTKWDKHKVKWDKIWEVNNQILMTQFINLKNGSEIKRIASFCHDN